MAAGITDARRLEALDDLAGIPFANKGDLREHYPFGLLAVPREQLVRVHASSGTHGKPTVVGYTRADLETWTELMARCMTMAGVRPGMVIHNANGYGLFTGGLGFHQGGERIGATVVPVSGGFTARQAMLLRDLGAHVLVATPSYALAIAQALDDAGVDPATLSSNSGCSAASRGPRGCAPRSIARSGSRRSTSTGCRRCAGRASPPSAWWRATGLHVQEDHFLVEVIDPADGQPCPARDEGELVFTTLTKEALPLIRYRTGDIGAITDRAVRLRAHERPADRLRGRRDDMLIVRGVNLYPSAVEHDSAGRRRRRPRTTG